VETTVISLTLRATANRAQKCENTKEVINPGTIQNHNAEVKSFNYKISFNFLLCWTQAT
jgi:hypothetical protein